MVWSNNSHKIRTLLMPFFDCRTVFRAAGGAILDGDAGEVDFSCERGRTDRASSPFVKEAAGSRRFAIALMLVWPFFVFAYLLHMSRCIRSKLCFVIRVERGSGFITDCCMLTSQPAPISSPQAQRPSFWHCWLRVNGYPHARVSYYSGLKLLKPPNSHGIAVPGSSHLVIGASTFGCWS